MSHASEHDVAAPPDALTRRTFMQRSGVAGAALAGGGLLAACGSSSKSSSAKAAAPAKPTAMGDQLQKILGKPTNLLAKGPGKFSLVGQFALTGAGSIYGVLQTDGWKLGTQHVAEWTNGRLVLDTTYYDNKSGLPQAEAAAGRQAGLAGTPILVSSYIYGFGALLPFSKQYKMFTPDPGGGSGPIPGPFEGKPYCYGFRASYPTDVLDGLYKYLRTKFPDKKKWFTVQPVIAPPYNNAVQAYQNNLNKTYNIESLGQVLAPLGATNYASTIEKVKSANPDVVIWTSFGTDTGYQAAEMARQGVTVINGAVDFQPAIIKVAGSALKDWYFGIDYLNTVNPPSDWSKFFLSEWHKVHPGAVPNPYNAAYYITAFAVARLMDDIIGSGGSLKSGDAYVKALEANPSFDHVYGGNGSTIGKLVMDTTTHSPKAIEMLCFQYLGGGSASNIKPLATYNVKAAGYKPI